jgi:hypothetical protein
MQQREDVPRGVPGGQHHGVAKNCIAVGGSHTVYFSVMQNKVCDPRFEAHFAARGDDRLTHGRYDAWQFVGADVRMGIHENVFRCSECGERFQHAGHVPALHAAGVELAIAVGTRATFAETIIAIGIHDMFPVDQRQITAACSNFLAALQNDGFQPAFNATQRGEQPRGAAAHDDDRRCFGNIRKDRWCGRCIGKFFLR